MSSLPAQTPIPPTEPSWAAPQAVLPIEPATYQRHPLHEQERIWTETNCYIDVWIELLHALGLDPVPATVAAFSADFQGDQWRFLKFDLADLAELYGIGVHEMNVWRPLAQHIPERLAAGQLVTVEADAFYLPDTAGVSYQLAHTKTTIVPNAIDVAGRRLGYFHNASYWELSGADFDRVIGLGSDGASLMPYVELIELTDLRRDGGLYERALAQARAHLRRHSVVPAAQRLAERVEADLAWLAGQDVDTFHLYSFGTLRQFGVTAELAADAVDWLTERGAEIDPGVVEDFRAASAAAKSCQFKLARIAAGRSASLEDGLARLVEGWSNAMTGLYRWDDMRLD